MILISIILPVYNGEKQLAMAIDSCINQTYKNIELIIVDDCSTDASLKIASDYQKKDERIKIITNATNKKLPASLNIGHRIAKGDLLTWTSHDNFYNANAIEVLSSELAQNNSDLVYSDMNLVYENSSKIKKRDLGDIESLPFGNCVGACFLYKKEVFIELNGYDENLFLVEDYDFWLRAFMKFKFFHVKQYLYNYSLQSESLTNQINLNESKRNLWLGNISLLYNQFLNNIGISNPDITDFFRSNLTFEVYDFNLIVANYSLFQEIEKQLLKTPNYKTKKSLKKAVIKQFKFKIASNEINGKNKKYWLFLFQNYWLYFNVRDYKSLMVNLIIKK